MRLFVALNFPLQVRQDLWQATASLRDLGLPVKWVRAEGIHLTLKFLGEVPEERDGELRAALGRAAAGARALTLELGGGGGGGGGGFGVFPDSRRPRVLWVGIEAEPALEILQHHVEQEFAPLGFPTEARAFHPHVTLGRAARDARPQQFAGLEAALERLRYDAAVVIDALDLMESTLQSGGAVYNVRHSERLP